MEILKRNLFNLPGVRTERKIIVFESDDWGSIRIPSRRIYQWLLRSGLSVNEYHYDQLDNLESKDDLLNLLDVLQTTKDSNNNSAVFTLNTIIANPNFQLIKEDGFENYHYELFTDTYSRYWGENLINIWQQGIEEELIVPQFHGREHLNVSLWMEALRGADKNAMATFNNHSLCYTGPTFSQYHPHYFSACHIMNSDDLIEKERMIVDGLNQFENVFGFNSSSFIACNYTWPEALENVIFNNGVKVIQGQRAQLNPDVVTGKIRVKHHYMGQTNRLGQKYLIRNCLFEPSSNPDQDWVDSCMRQISNAFFYKKPAIISSHRVNYIGSKEKRNSDIGLRSLGQLFKRIEKKWPDSEFLSTVDLLNEVLNK